jgi:hypothetical protein
VIPPRLNGICRARFSTSIRTPDKYGNQFNSTAAHGIQLIVVKFPEAKKGFVLLPKRWVVERSFAWTARFRRLARDDERLPETLAGLHFLAFAILLLKRFVSLAILSS